MAVADQIRLLSDSSSFSASITNGNGERLLSDAYSGPGWTTRALGGYFPSDMDPRSYAMASAQEPGTGQAGREYSVRAFVDRDQAADLTAEAAFLLDWQFLALGDGVSLVLSMWGEQYYSSGGITLRDTTLGSEQLLFDFSGGGDLHNQTFALENGHTYALSAMLTASAVHSGDPDGRFVLSTAADIVPAQVPEPGSLTLLAAGLAGAAAARKARH